MSDFAGFVCIVGTLVVVACLCYLRKVWRDGE